MSNLPRRTFLGLGAAPLAQAMPSLGEAPQPIDCAKRIVSANEIGRIVYCEVRAPRGQMREWAGFARSAGAQAFVDCAVSPIPAIKFHGEEATLVVTRDGCRLFPGACADSSAYEFGRATWKYEPRD